MKLKLPENYYTRVHGLYTSIFDSDISADAHKDFPHRQVASVVGPMKDISASVIYWGVAQIEGDRINMPSLEAAIAHVEMMAALGLLGHGYTKGMVDANL